MPLTLSLSGYVRKISFAASNDVIEAIFHTLARYREDDGDSDTFFHLSSRYLPAVVGLEEFWLWPSCGRRDREC